MGVPTSIRGAGNAPVNPEVAGSNPVDPAIKLTDPEQKTLALLDGLGVPYDLIRIDPEFADAWRALYQLKRR